MTTIAVRHLIIIMMVAMIIVSMMVTTIVMIVPVVVEILVGIGAMTTDVNDLHPL